MKKYAVFVGHHVEGVVDVPPADHDGELILRSFGPNSLRVKDPARSAEIAEPADCILILYEDGSHRVSLAKSDPDGSAELFKQILAENEREFTHPGGKLKPWKKAYRNWLKPATA